MTKEPKDWQRCSRSPFTGVHAWEYPNQAIKLSEGDWQIPELAPVCKFCHKQPPPTHRDELARKVTGQMREVLIAKEQRRKLRELNKIGGDVKKLNRRR